MQTTSDNLISRLTFDAQKTVTAYPPQFRHTNKRILYSHVCPPDCRHHGTVAFSRWRALDLPQRFCPSSLGTALEVKQNFFDYEPNNGQELETHWYLNFAHSNLFCAYGLAVFAQDEIQVAEHPVLASLTEALAGSEAKPLTVEMGVPTPILIMGAERRCSIDTSINAAAGRPNGLYGQQFARAKAETIINSTTLIDPHTITNIIAMEAPSFGHGTYTEDQINYILTTAYTGFSAACHDSRQDASAAGHVVIHTGFWGCGAYGGNRILMALLQLLAARMSGVNRLVFHAGDRSGVETVDMALHVLDDDLFVLNTGKRKVTGPLQSLLGTFKKTSSVTAEELTTSELISKIRSLGFEWGVSDGN